MNDWDTLVKKIMLSLACLALFELAWVAWLTGVAR